MRIHSKGALGIAAILAGVVSTVTLTWADMDVGEARQIPYVGRLELNGAAVPGAADFRFAFFATADADASCLVQPAPDSCGLWWEQQDAVPLYGGAFSVVLGALSELQDHVFAQPALFLAIAVKDPDATAFTLLAKKKRLYAVPYAARAAAANNYEVVGDLIVGGDSALGGGLAVSGAAELSGGLSVSGASVLDGDLQLNGRAGVGQAPSSNANLHVKNTGDVGVFVGDRSPFGSALFETDVVTGRTHAWFAEGGSRVFSVGKAGEVWSNGDVVAANNKHGTCTWTARFSEEQSATYCAQGRYVAGAQCFGSYCDQIALYCCEL